MMANYKLSDKEEQLANAFMERHRNCIRKTLPFAYIYKPNGIGISVSIRCEGCNEEEDITDVECW